MGLAKKACLLLFISFMCAGLILTVWSQGSSLTVTKSASTKEFTWDEPVVITLVVKNGASTAVNNVTILDYVPDNFDGAPETLVNSGVVNISRATILPDEEVSYSYTIKGKKDLGTDSNITLRAAQVFFKTETGESGFQTSEDIVLTVKTDNLNATLGLIAQSVLLLVGSFVFGFLGSFINSLAESDVSSPLSDSDTTQGTFTNKEGKTPISLIVPKKVTKNKQFKADIKIEPELLTEVKEKGSYKIEIVLTRTNQVWRKEVSWSKTDKEFSATLSPEIAGEHSIYCRIINDSDKTLVSDYSTKAITIQVNKGLAYNLLIGGVAGMITLASLETLSAIFADTGINITVKTIVTLTVATVASGFVPKKILDSFTKTLIKEKEDAEKETNKAQQQQEEMDTSKTGRSAVDELINELVGENK